MANLISTRLILASMKASVHSLGIADISRETGLGNTAVRSTLAELKDAGLIKENAANRCTYFTRTPHRNAIQAFLDGNTNELPGMTFTTGTVPVGSAAAAVDRSSDARAILLAIKNAPHALYVYDMPETSTDFGDLISDLECAGLIKKHADGTDCYFTRKPKRAAIQAFLDGTLSLDAMLNGDEPTASDANAPTTSAPTPIAPPSPEAAPAPASDAVGDFQAAMIAIREITNAFLAKYGR